jgi:pSer/pThr/pTyr-binding forkhead associated (FHA) protein
MPLRPTLVPLRETARWEAHVEADAAYFQQGATDGVLRFPTGTGNRVVRLRGERVVIGRRRESEGIYPQVDLAVPPDDPGVSTVHAILERQPDGSYCLVDHGSRNGTRLNDDPKPVEQDRRIPLKDGDRIFVGAWSRVTIRHAAPEHGGVADQGAM